MKKLNGTLKIIPVTVTDSSGVAVSKKIVAKSKAS